MTISTTCNALNWTINKATEYYRSDEHVTYRFRGNVSYRMVNEITDWMKAQNARYNDGRTRTSYNLTIEDKVDTDRHWYNHTNIDVSRGNTNGTGTDLEVMIVIYDCAISDEDMKEMINAH